ncbi:DUF5658 family protein [Clostridium thermarum]|uniref:DUF5658 family protein n=1 Tax=Clostridium thermarum TaxID=1716543 RepID=UPI001FAE6625|nr:DUF5658 family protein [Clostridium thermarum]
MLVRFFTGYDLLRLRIKLALIYLLNLSDIIFTLVLLNTGLYMEANIIMRNIVEDNSLSLAVKAIMPFVLILILAIRIQKADERQKKISNIVINGCLLYYVLINVSHIIWSILYLV